jgi:transcription elongation factor Elf1
MKENKTEDLEKEIPTDFLCPRCGNILTGDLLNAFCVKCGYRFCPSCSE